MEKGRQIRKEEIKTLFESKYIRVVDLQYEPGKHYYNATRRTEEDLAAIKSKEEFQSMLPDAVSCIVILVLPKEQPKLLLSYEYRYPAGQFLLSVPAGLIDHQDKEAENPVLSAAFREIKEETGLTAGERDFVKIVNPLLFSTPGMTDESNALVCAVLHLADLEALTQEGATGSEQFDGFLLLTKAEAQEILRNGRDAHGNYYSIYTWAALTYFVSEAWR